MTEDTPWILSSSATDYNSLIGDYSVLGYEYVLAATPTNLHWVCGDWESGSMNMSENTQNVTSWDMENWKRINHTVLYCLSQPPGQNHCKLECSLVIMIGGHLKASYK